MSLPRSARAAVLVAATVAGVLVPVFSPQANAAGCVAANDTHDGGIKATNTCLSSTIGINLDIWGPDGPCRAVDGPVTNGHGPGQYLTWTADESEFVTAADVYQCW